MHVFHYCGATGIDLRRAPIMGTRTFGTQTTDPGTYANTFRVKHIRQSDSDLGDGYLTFPSYIDFSGDTDSRHTYSMFRHSRGVETIEFTNWKPSCITGWFGGCINLKTFKSKGMNVIGRIFVIRSRIAGRWKVVYLKKAQQLNLATEWMECSDIAITLNTSIYQVLIYT